MEISAIPAIPAFTGGLKCLKISPINDRATADLKVSRIKNMPRFSRG
jgi:hypothetical protein